MIRYVSRFIDYVFCRRESNLDKIREMMRPKDLSELCLPDEFAKQVHYIRTGELIED